MFHLGDGYLCTSRILLPSGDNGETLEAAPNEENEIQEVQYKFGALNGHQRPTKAPHPHLNKCKYNVLLAWESGEKIYESLSVLEADASVTLAAYGGLKGTRILYKVTNMIFPV